MNGLYLISCLAIVVFLAVVAIVVIILNSGKRERSRPSPTPARVVVNETKNQTPHKGVVKAQLLIRQGFLDRDNAEKAKNHALAAFRSGDREIRLQAVKLLLTLHEVEEF